MTLLALIAIQTSFAMTSVRSVTVPPYTKSQDMPNVRPSQFLIANSRYRSNVGRVVFSNPKAEISAIGPFEVEFSGDDIITIHSGRVMVTTKSAGASSVFRTILRTPSVVMGVRGTEFMASHFPLLNESEVISFQHEVQLTDSSNQKTQLIKQHQWGGKGGRFGAELVKPISIPEPAVHYFRSQF